MADQRHGVALVLCAPSGTGKTTLVHRLLDEFDNFAYSVSYTTRAPRGTEQDGVDYHFVDKTEFERLRDENFFAEWAQVHGNYYGTPLGAVLESLRRGKDLLFDIDVQGARQLKDNLKLGTFVFVYPPSMCELRRRLTTRGTDDPEAIERRLSNAKGEILQSNFFDAWIVNDDLDQAYDELRSVFHAATLAPALHKELQDKVLADWCPPEKENEDG